MRVATAGENLETMKAGVIKIMITNEVATDLETSITNGQDIGMMLKVEVIVTTTTVTMTTADAERTTSTTVPLLIRLRLAGTTIITGNTMIEIDYHLRRLLVIGLFHPIEL